MPSRVRPPGEVMDSDRWKKQRELFERARDLSSDERAEFLEAHCAGDTDLRAELEALLVAHDFARSKSDNDPAGEAGRPEGELIGSTIGDYRVVELIGEGGMGRVYRAYDQRLDRYVALKVLPEEVAEDPRRVARFKREARILASLSHAHIGAIYDVEEYEGRLVLVLEWIRGPTLAERLSRGPVPVDEAVDIARQIAAGLEVAHAGGVIHRDLKPANVILTPDGSAKVVDFGIARAADRPRRPGEDPTDHLDATAPGQIIGTVAYMSPEQLRGLHVDPRTDIWSFGVLLFEMLAGTGPFMANNAADTMALILRREPDWDALDRRVPASLRGLLLRCLEKNARRRLQAIGEARLALEPGSESLLASGSRRTRIRRRLLPLGAVGAALVLLITAVMQFGRAGAAPEQGATGRRVGTPVQVSFTGDVFEAVIAPVGPFVATLRHLEDEDVVTVLDLTGGDPVDVARGDRICCLAWSPDATRLAFQRFVSNGRTVHTVPARGGLERTVRANAPWLRGLRWSPDGTRMATWADNRDLVQVTDLASGDAIQYVPESIAAATRWVVDVDWGPTGQFAIATQSETGAYEVHVVESEGQGAGSTTNDAGEHVADRLIVSSTLLTTHARAVDGVRWAGDGGALYYFRSNGRSRDLLRIEPSAGAQPEIVREALQIVPDPGGRIRVGISRDSVLSLASGSRYSNLWLLPFAASESARRLTNRTMTIRRPVVSPAGDQVAFEAAGAGGFDIFVLDLEDGGIRQVTETRTGAVSPAWSPSGDSIAFVSADDGRRRVWVTHFEAFVPEIMLFGSVSDAMWRNLEWAPGRDLLVQTPDLQFGRYRSVEAQRLLTSDPESRNWVLQARYSPDGASVAITWNRANVLGMWIVHESSEPRQLLNGEYNPIGWSPDGSRIYVYESQERRISAVDPRTGRMRFVREFPFEADEIDMDVTRDGLGVIAAVSEAPGDAVIVDLRGSR